MRLLNLSRNQLEGQIPASISEISILEQLDLAKNNLSGQIPQELSKLTMLASLDVSFNKLCGPIPIGTQFDTFSETSFQRKKCLCGYPLQTCQNSTKRPPMIVVGGEPNVKMGWLSRVDEKMSLRALEMGMGIGFAGVLSLFILCKRARIWVMGMPYNQPQAFYGVYRLPQ